MKILTIVIFAFLLLGATVFREPFCRCQIPISATIRASVNALAILKAIEQYEKDVGRLPSSLNELVGTYLDDVPKDPWGNEYVFDHDKEKESRIFSMGSDGIEGGVGMGIDIYSNTDREKRIKEILEPFWGCDV